MIRRGLKVGTSLFTLGATATLYSHHVQWRDRCCANPEIIVNNDEHLVHDLKSLRDQFKPTWYLTNSHWQTVINAVLRMPKLHDLQFNVKRTKHTFVDDGATVYLDWITPKDTHGEKSPELTLFIMPGVVSGTDGVGILNLVEAAVEKNYRCIVFNYMSKEGLNVMTKDEYPIVPGISHSIADLKNILRVIENELGADHKMLAVGMSLGANVLVQYIGEQSSTHHMHRHKSRLFTAALDQKPKYFVGEPRLPHGSNRKHPFIGCVSIGNPYDLDFATDVLHSNKLHHFLYDSFFVQKRKEMIKLNLQYTMAQEEEQPFQNEILKRLDKCDTTRELDEQVSLPLLHRQMEREGKDPSVVSTLHSFYNLSSSRNWIEYIDVPLLSINARDDPISRYEAIPIDRAQFNKNLAFVITQCGGHVGWLDTLLPFSLAGYKQNYADRVVMEFIEKIARATGTGSSS